LELVSDRPTRTPLVPWQGDSNLNKFFSGLLEHGLYILGRYNVAIVSPPLTISIAEIDEAVAILDEALGRLK